jgi:hypothetical protein
VSSTGHDLAPQHSDGVAVSTDEPWVYVGYWAHIKDLLKSGVQVHFGHRTGALHMKSAKLRLLGPFIPEKEL